MYISLFHFSFLLIGGLYILASAVGILFLTGCVNVRPIESIPIVTAKPSITTGKRISFPPVRFCEAYAYYTRDPIMTLVNCKEDIRITPILASYCNDYANKVTKNAKRLIQAYKYCITHA